MSATSVRAALAIVVSMGLVHCAAGRSEGWLDRPSAAALVAAERSSCAGVSEAERDGGPFGDRSRILAAFDLVESVPLGKTNWDHVRGAKVVVRAEPGVTRPWLSRLTQCYVAMRATGQNPDGPVDDPLAVGRPEVSVDEREASFVVVIRGRDDDEGREIARRARNLVAH